AVFESEPPEALMEEEGDDVEEILTGEMWERGYVSGVRQRRGSRSVSDAGVVFWPARRRLDSIAPNEV
ncbi:hypothetical protein LTR66_014409, partial [Elasticomyces elasticus]